MIISIQTEVFVYKLSECVLQENINPCYVYKRISVLQSISIIEFSRNKSNAVSFAQKIRRDKENGLNLPDHPFLTTIWR